MPNPLKTQSINLLIIVPLLVMSYHIYEFFETVPGLFRIGLAVSFDLLVIVVFYQLKDKYIRASRQATRITWSTLFVMIAFQLYVNVWAFWDLASFRAIISGAIFPVIVGLISYINMLRQQQVEKQKREAAEQAEREDKALGADSNADLALLAEERPFDGEKADKAIVIKAYGEDPSELSRDRFRGATNWRSVRRWWKKLNQGQTP